MAASQDEFCRNCVDENEFLETTGPPETTGKKSHFI